MDPGELFFRGRLLLGGLRERAERRLRVVQWDAIPKHSAPPYELTHKSNGCIILIAALSPRHIIVTSKHSIGAHALVGTESVQSHSQRGEFWLEKHLATIGKTKEDLAAELYARDLTAVAEVRLDSRLLMRPP